MQERYISSGSSRLHIAVWEPSGERKAIMQISAWHDRIYQKVQSFCELPQSGRNPGDRE